LLPRFGRPHALAHALRRAVGSWLALVLVAGCTGVSPRYAGDAATLFARAEVRTSEGGIPPEELVSRAAGARLVCIGEQHDEPAHHRLQHALFDALAARAAAGGRPFALGLEMFGRADQPALDAYGRGRIDAAELERGAWRWGFAFSMYAPILHAAHEHGVRVLGLNAPRGLTRRIARGGLEGLTPAERASLPDLDRSDLVHRRAFDRAMAGSHVLAPPAAERFYLAQVVWDETMAETAAAWLARSPRHQLVVLAGNAHCHPHAIPRRTARRVPGLEALAILTAIPGNEPADPPSETVVLIPPGVTSRHH
jgi:uncharacterized iron-regulated protein